MDNNQIGFEINRDLIQLTNLPSYVYLIGRPVNGFEDKLPRGIDIVRYYFHFENIDETKKNSQIAREIQNIYQRAGIPTIHFESIRSKVKRLIYSVKSVVETRKSKSSTQVQKELTIFEKLSQLFEVTQNESSLSIIKRDFLFDQRTQRQQLVVNLSQAFLSDQQATTSGLQQSISQLRENESEELLVPVSYTDSSDFDENNTNLQRNISEFLILKDSEEVIEPFDFDDSPDFMPSRSHDFNNRKIQLSDCDKNELSKCGGSYRIVAKALAIGIKTAGGDPNDYAISKTALCSQLSAFRTSNMSGILEQIASNNELAILHFDGKKMAKINQKHIGKDSRMVALCHTQTKDVPLGLPILESGEAESYASNLVELCEKYNVSQRIVGISCDTTVTNTGEWGGACVLFENKIEKEILNLLCRHHIFEVLLSSAFHTSFGIVDAPTITLFEELKVNWKYIKDRGFLYRPCEISVLGSFYLRNFYENARETLINHAKIKSIRDDYAELTDLCLKYLGIKTKKSFMVPGAVSKSRWMAKAIYAVKMYLFRDELELEEDFQEQLLEFSLFVVLIYCKHWNRCTNAIDAPVNDLELINELQQYINYNEVIATAVLKSFENHLWYLGEELVALSLFSDKVSVEDKNRMRLQVLSSHYPMRNENSLRLRNYFDGMELPDLVKERSRFLFSVLNLESDFLLENAAVWHQSKSYKKNKRLIQNWIVVVNDLAERALGRADQIIQNQRARSEERFQNMFLSLYS